MKLAQFIFRNLGLIGPNDRLVKVYSWLPYWDGEYLCWPSMLVDERLLCAGISPCWNWARIRPLLFGEQSR